MRRIKEMFNKKEEGFTLIELIIVIAILAILAAVAIPNIMGAVQSSRKKTDITNARIIAEAAAVIRVQYENHNGDIARINVTDLASAANPETDFGAALYTQLSSNPPVPKYKGATATNFTKFYVSITSGVITVEVAGDTYVAANASEVYPTPALIYE